jgi:hypothetical protein
MSAEEGEEGEGGGEELRQLVVSLASDAVSWEVGSGQPSADDAKGHHDDHGFDDSADPAVSSQKLFVGLSTLQTVDFTDRLWTSTTVLRKARCHLVAAMSKQGMGGMDTTVSLMHLVRKTASFFEFSLCLSRAGLGKLVVFI